MTFSLAHRTMRSDQPKEVSSMKSLVPRNKMSKKDRRSLDMTKRTVWTMNPVTRVRESGKLYNRRKAKYSTEI